MLEALGRLGFLLSSTLRLLGACQAPGHRELAPPAGQRGLCTKLCPVDFQGLIGRILDTPGLRSP